MTTAELDRAILAYRNAVICNWQEGCFESSREERIAERDLRDAITRLAAAGGQRDA